MRFESSSVFLVVAGLVLAAAWVMFVLLGRERLRWAAFRRLTSMLDSRDTDPVSQATQFCLRVRDLLDAPYCSLWVLGQASGLFHPVAHNGTPGGDDVSPDSETRDLGHLRAEVRQATIPGEVPSEIVARAWTTGDFQEWTSGGQQWVVQPVAPHQEAGGALVVRLGRKGRFDRELLRLASIPAAVLAMRFGQDRELLRTRRELDDIRHEMVAESKLAAVGRLAAGVAHELNTPLATVLTMVGSLSRKATDADVKRRLELGREALEKCKSIIEKLLIFSRGPVESEEGLTFSRFVRASMELNHIVRGSIDFLAENLANEGITVRSQLGDIPPIRANSTQWGQVLSNLLANARDAFREHPVPEPTIVVKTEVEGNHILLTVSDNGPGIPAEIVSRIFDPFFTTKDIGKGTGLGLAIVREIVKKHDGRIEVQSKPGEGTTFLVRVPAGSPMARAAAGPSLP